MRKGGITTDPPGTKKVVREHYEQLHVKRFETMKLTNSYKNSMCQNWHKKNENLDSTMII